MNTRWSDYVLTEDFSAFWTERLRDPLASVCVVLGLGFDPRSLIALKKLSAIGGTGQVNAVVMRLQTLNRDTQPGRDLVAAVEANARVLNALPNVAQVAVADVALHDTERFSIGGRSVLSAISPHIDVLANFTHTLIDLSGTPRSVFFPLIAFLCNRADAGVLKNLHVAVLENDAFDSKIVSAELSDADYIHTFRMEGSKKVVWLPVLGSNQRERILKIYNQLKADCIETVAVLPFPGRSLRTVDEVLLSNSEVLYSELGVAPGNILLCDAKNPFDVYRKIVGLHDYYVEKLQAHIGSLTTVVSPLSSKLLSLGALLAAVERKLPVSYVEAGLYTVRNGPLDVTLFGDQEPTEIWLTGEPYAGAN
jgi:hypothetical protein